MNLFRSLETLANETFKNLIKSAERTEAQAEKVARIGDEARALAEWLDDQDRPDLDPLLNAVRDLVGTLGLKNFKSPWSAATDKVRTPQSPFAGGLDLGEDGLPASWTPEQRAQFEETFNSLRDGLNRALKDWGKK